MHKCTNKDTFITNQYVCMNVPVVLDAPLAQQDQARQQHPEKYRQNMIWILRKRIRAPMRKKMRKGRFFFLALLLFRRIHSNKSDTKYLIFRRTLSPWYPISPGSPRFPTSP